ncbi:hypothetical protein [Leptospira weilii]|uniref:hypothetical protein n=1 Tax=Leptospira weilii TaxID=28184 RepID=UPI001EF26F5B|nr:hypothetical protein [Leptospira weilii]ULH30884.1 hypothetical protein FH586_22420 [Leptospira weilii]
MEYNHFIPALIEETKSRYETTQERKNWPKLNFEKNHVLIGVRGISIEDNQVFLNDNQFDRFNDILFNIYPGGKSWGSRVVTMDPGKVSKEILLKYGITKGEARAEEGLYLVKIGLHHEHIAFNQASAFSFRRDANGDHIWNHLDPLFKGYIGMNIHAQGMEKDSVGVSSLGCTVTRAHWSHPEWLSLISVFQGAELEARQKDPHFPGFCYALYDQKSAKKILEAKE